MLKAKTNPQVVSQENIHFLHMLFLYFNKNDYKFATLKKFFYYVDLFVD